MSQNILLCRGEGCKLRHYCFRSTAEVLGRQDFFASPPLDEQSQTCEFFYENALFDADIRLKAYQIWQEEGQPEGRDFWHWQTARELILAQARQS